MEPLESGEEPSPFTIPDLSRLPLDQRVAELERLLRDAYATANAQREQLRRMVAETSCVKVVRGVLSAPDDGIENGMDTLPTRDSPVSPPPKKKKKKTGISGEKSLEPDQLDKVDLPLIPKDETQKKFIRQAISQNPLLGKLEPQQVKELVQCMALRHVNPGECVIREGCEGEELFVTISGTLEVSREGQHVRTLTAGHVFGELALLYGCMRTATVRAGEEKNVSLWWLGRSTFQAIVMRTGLVRHRQYLNFVRSVEAFKGFDNDSLLRLVDALGEERYADQDYIIRQGAIGETFYIVRDGEVVVTQRQEPAHAQTTPAGHRPNSNVTHKTRNAHASPPVELRRLHAGETFGEKALLNDDVRTANVIANGEVTCLTLGRQAFKRLVGPRPPDTTEPPPCFYDDIRENPKRCASPDDGLDFATLSLDDMDYLGILGKGGFGRVDLVQVKSDQSRTFALKCLLKKHIVERKQQAHVFGERDVLLSVIHPFIARLYRTYRDARYLYMLMEPCLGGEMWCVLRQCGRLTETEARFAMGCAVEALAYLHRHHIVYRDLKPENLMLDASGYCKLVDFGFSKKLSTPALKTWTFCGTPEYMAPEVILSKGHGFAVDFWALGILLFELLSGWPPFTNSDVMVIYSAVLAGLTPNRFPPKGFPRNARDLVLQLCRVNPSDRLGMQSDTFAGIRRHIWFDNFDWIGLREQTLDPPIVPDLDGPDDLSNFDQSKATPRDKDAPKDLSGWDEGF